MRTAIQATHVILDTAIIPGVSLIPSSLVILKEPIPGYNNILLTASSNMLFGLNSEVNKLVKPKEPLPKPEAKGMREKPEAVQNEKENEIPQLKDQSEAKETENVETW